MRQNIMEEKDNNMKFEITDGSEVFWASTNEYKCKFDDDTEITFRIYENSKGMEFLVLDEAEDEWDELKDGDPYHDAFYLAWQDGALHLTD